MPRLWKEHFEQTCEQLQYCKRFEGIRADFQIYLPNPPISKRTLIFDMDETLIHCLEDSSEKGDVSFEITVNNQNISIEVNLRPYVREMLGRLSKHYEIVVFTASYACYADKILDYLDPEQHISHRIYRSSCLVTQENIHIKDLSVLNRELSRTLLVDNSAYSFCL